MALGKGFFALFPEGKSAGQGPHSGSELSADFTSWTPAAYGAPMVAEPLTVAELEDLGMWVDEFGRWWSRSEVFPGRGVMPGLVGRAGLGLFCPSGCNDGGRVEVDVPVVQVVDVGAVQLLDKVVVSWRQSGKGRRLDAFSWE